MRRSIVLEQLHIPAPCPADWDAMAGDERSRFCGQCRKHVFDLSSHTRAEAEAMVAGDYPHGLCVQIRRDDRGRVVTKDRRPWWAAASVAATFVLSLVGCSRQDRDREVRGSPTPITRTAGMVAVGEMSKDAATRPTTRTSLGDVGPTTRPAR